MTDTPKRTLTIKRTTTGNTGTPAPAAPGAITRSGKRIIRRADLPAVTPTRPGKPAHQAGKGTYPKKKPTRKPDPKKPAVSPSDLKARELNDRLNGFKVWRDYLPLAIGVDKTVFKLVNDECFPGASKKVVQKVLKRHTHHGRYLQAMVQGGGRFHLDGTEEGSINGYQQQLAAEMMQQREQGKG